MPMSASGASQAMRAAFASQTEGGTRCVQRIIAALAAKTLTKVGGIWPGWSHANATQPTAANAAGPLSSRSHCRAEIPDRARTDRKTRRPPGIGSSRSAPTSAISAGAGLSEPRRDTSRGRLPPTPPERRRESSPGARRARRPPPSRCGSRAEAVRPDEALGRRCPRPPTAKPQPPRMRSPRIRSSMLCSSGCTLLADGQRSQGAQHKDRERAFEQGKRYLRDGEDTQKAAGRDHPSALETRMREP